MQVGYAEEITDIDVTETGGWLRFLQPVGPRDH